MLRQQLDRLISGLKPAEKAQKNQWVAVSICFVLAVTLWFLVSMNTQNFESTFQIPFQVRNVPSNFQLMGEIPDHVSVLARGRGIDLLSQKWETTGDTITVDFPTYQNQEYFIAHNHLEVINAGIKYDLRPLGMNPDSIPLQYVPKDFKRVPLVLDMELDIPKGYRPSREVKADFTDSIMVVGPEGDLAQIDSWKTVRYRTPRFKAKSTFRVGLETIAPFEVAPRNVQVTVEPSLFTERTLILPLRAINVPPNLMVRFDPIEIEVDLLVLLDKYEALEKAGIQAVVDFASLDERSPKAIPTIVNVPKYAELQRFRPLMVSYLIIEER